MLSKRFFATIIFLTATSLTLLGGLLLYSKQTPHLFPLLSTQKSPLKADIPIAILETGGSHDEVVAALVHAFGSNVRANISLYQVISRFGMSDIMNNFTLPHDVPKSQEKEAFGGPQPPMIVISTTCDFDLRNYEKRFKELLDLGQTYLFCVIHHSDRYNDEEWQTRLGPWLEKDLMSLVTLSPHTAKFLKEQGLTSWKPELKKAAENHILSMTPVFPVTLPSLSEGPSTPNFTAIHNAEAEDIADNEEDHEHEVASDELAFVLQGNYESSRRDFDAVFADIEHLISATSSTPPKAPSSDSSAKADDIAHTPNNEKITLRLLGSGNRPEVPDAVKKHVVFDERLSYKAYYSLLSHSAAILPAFASDDYLDRKASSSVPAALLAGTPLIANDELVHAYSYLGSQNVYRQSADETEVAVMERVVKLSREERMRKQGGIREWNRKLVEENIGLAGDWIKLALSRLGEK